MAAIFAAKGHRVIGVDVNQTFVDRINAGQAPVEETGLQDMIDRTNRRLSATTDLVDAVAQTEMTFLIVPTPSDPTGAFSMKYALEAGEKVGQGLKKKQGYHLVILTSTVMPGDTKGKLLPVIEAVSGKKVGVDFGLCYSPEFISLGSVIKEMLNPDFLLIGESDAKAGQMLADFYKTINDNKPGVARMTCVNAELTKVALNTYVTTKISYANMLAQICERLDGGNVDSVTNALGMDTRIGPKYLKGSVAYGGPCFPRDNVALVTLAKSLGVPAPLPEATDCINRAQVARLQKIVDGIAEPGATVGILGLAYKPETNVIEKAQGFELAQALNAAGYDVIAYDPHANATASRVLPSSVRFAATAKECVEAASIVVVTTPCKEFTQLKADVFASDEPKTVLDCWRLLNRVSIGGVCNYLALGTDDLRAVHAAANQRAHAA